MEETIKYTPLHDWHLMHGANMGSFAGYDMPMWYKGGAKEEHLSVILSAGLFDTSHMAVISVKGKGAFDLLQRCFSRDLAWGKKDGKDASMTGKCVYGVFLNDSGGVIDDAIVYGVAPSDYLVVVNAGNGEKLASHLRIHAGTHPVDIEDHTDKLGKMDLQGPLAGRILQDAGAFSGMDIREMNYFTFKGHFLGNVSGPSINGIPVLLSRTGYTGEFGFEVFMKKEAMPAIWQSIIDAGEKWHILPCGLAARDSLRTGAVLPLSHQDIGDWLFLNHPWTFALPFDKGKKGFTKPFIGKDALESNMRTHSHVTYPFAGFDLRKVTTSKAPSVFTKDGKKIGNVLTCVTDMAIGRHDRTIISIAEKNTPQHIAIKGLSCGFLKSEVPLKPMDMVTLDDGSRKIDVEIRADLRPHRTARHSMDKMMVS
ncbi:MAG: aminomethyl transferase family protein [Proteobacteria bacterium]|nr:aminomethyl transferase family protein [Pseudomonadota bacterium]